MIGAFVSVTVSPYLKYGFGKLTRLLGRHAVVTYFDVPDDLKPPEVIVPLTAVRVVDLPEQTRVFRLDEVTQPGRLSVPRRHRDAAFRASPVRLQKSCH